MIIGKYVSMINSCMRTRKLILNSTRARESGRNFSTERVEIFCPGGPDPRDIYFSLAKIFSPFQWRVLPKHIDPI